MHKGVVMSRFDENYFTDAKDDGSKPRRVEDVVGQDETVLWKGKPKKNAFVLNSAAKMFPIALVWIAFDSFFIAMLAKQEPALPASAIAPLCAFFALHLAPVWIWLGKTLTAGKKYKNTEYVLTDKRVIVRTGTVGVDFKSVYYKDITAVNLRTGIIDRALKVGDIYITSNQKATALLDLENASDVRDRLEKLVSDVKDGAVFSLNAKATFVKCQYCGCKNKSTDKTCSSCGAPLE